MLGLVMVDGLGCGFGLGLSQGLGSQLIMNTVFENYVFGGKNN
jgi:hypothetical protein